MGSAENAAGAELREYLDRRQMLYHRIHCGLVQTGGGWVDLGAAGWPDWIVLPGGGRVVLVETKTRDGVLEPSQLAVHATLRDRDYPVVVWRSLDDVTRLIESVGR